MNPDYLDRLFKKEFGLSVSQYIKEKKIDYAKMLLRTTNLSVSEIAQRLGYINLSHFTASFKQITNTTPVNYRKNINFIGNFLYSYPEYESEVQQ